MSRSKRKNLVFPNCCNGNTQKPWKQHINRIFRRKSRARLYSAISETGDVLKDYFYRDKNKRKFADIWISPSDGRHTIEMLNKDEWNSIRAEDKKLIPNSSFNRYDSNYNPKHKTYEEYVSNFKRLIISK